MLLNEAQTLVRDSMRSFAADRLKPYAAQWDREHHFPAEALRELGALGAYGMVVPDVWGGAGLDYVSLAVALEEIAAGDGSTSTIISVQNSVVCGPIAAFGSDAQKDKYLRPLASGAMLGCFCLTEPQAGSDAAALTTRARYVTNNERDREGTATGGGAEQGGAKYGGAKDGGAKDGGAKDGGAKEGGAKEGGAKEGVQAESPRSGSVAHTAGRGHYVLDGVKQFITSGKHAEIALVFAVTDPGAGKRGISAFIVETGAPDHVEGYGVARVEDKLGQRASDTAQIVLEGCKVPSENRLGNEGDGYRIALANLEAGRIGIAAQAVGMARAALEAALVYGSERRSFGKTLVEHQAVSFRLADMATRIEAARQLVWHAASLRDAGVPCLKEASMAKLFASEMAEGVCSDAIQIHGGYGYLQDFPVERIYRDVRVCQIYEGTSDIQRMVIGRALLR